MEGQRRDGQLRNTRAMAATSIRYRTQAALFFANALLAYQLSADR
jgi:hypothetical protein